MNLQIKHRRIGQPVLQRIPVHAPVTGMPNSDISTYIDVVGSGPIDRQGIMLDVEEAVAACATANLPTRPVEVPDPPPVSHSAKGHIDRATGRVGPVHGDICDQTHYSNRPGRDVVEA